MRDDAERLTALANVVAVGQGWIEAAREFCRKRGLAERFACVVAPENAAYREFGLRRGSAGQLVGPKQVLKGARTFFTPGTHQGKPQRGDVAQLPGVFVVGTDGRIRYAHRGRDASDNPPVEELLAALERVSGG